MGSQIKSIVTALGIDKLISATFNTLKNSVSGAVSRLDTLNNYPKVMKNIGFSAEDAEKSINKLSNGIQGLPTALDEIVTNAQSLALSLGNLDLATDVAIALNDGMLTYGATASDVTNATTQLNQMISAGKYDMQSWLSVTQSAPGLMDTVAKSLLGASANQETLRSALNNGKVSTEEFLNALIDLDQNGNGEITAFKDAVQDATGGIGTSMTNLKTRITKGVADIIESFDKWLQSEGFGSIAEIIDNIGKKAKEVLSNIADKLPDLLSTLERLMPLIVGVTTSFITLKTAMAISSIIKKVKKEMDGMTIAQYALNKAMNLNPIGIIVSLIAGLVAGFIYLWNTSEGFRNFWKGLWDGIKSVFEAVCNGIITFFTETIPNAWNNFITSLQNFANSIWETLANVWNNIVSFFTETIPQWIQNVINWFANLPYMIGYHIGQIWGNLIKFGLNVWNWITVDLPQIIQGIIDWFAQLPGRIWEWLLNTVAKINQWGKDMWTKATTAVSNMVNSVVNWFKQLPGRIWTWLLQTIQNVVNWIFQMKQKAEQGVSNVVNSIINFFKELPQKMLEIGKNIVDGIWNGIKNAWNGLKDGVANLGRGLADGIKGALGIHSPSRVFRDEVGRFIPQGIAVGIEADTDSAVKAIDNMNDDIMNEMNKAVNMETGSINANASVKSNNSMLNIINASFNVDGSVEIDGQRAGRILTPHMTKTLKGAGAY